LFLGAAGKFHVEFRNNQNFCIRNSSGKCLSFQQMDLSSVTDIKLLNGKLSWVVD
jgi:hypothetical protein